MLCHSVEIFQIILSRYFLIILDLSNGKHMQPVCSSCGKTRSDPKARPICPCGGIYVLKPDFRYHEGNYSSHFPYLEKIVSLGEAVTPLVHLGSVDLKLEYFSPTFSYKDRGTKALISQLSTSLAEGSRINEDSSGNAGASIAAYGAAAGFDVNIFVPEKTVAGKIKQIEHYGAAIHRISGSREDVSEACFKAEGYFASHVYNPEFRDGMREISYEIFHQYNGKPPRNVFIPVSAGTLILGVISGFRHLQEAGEISDLPNFVAVQTEQVSPLCARLSGVHYDSKRSVSSLADALVSQAPPLLDLMESEIRENGTCITVTEQEIVESRVQLARKGILVEYSSATVYAAHTKWKKDGDSLLIMTGNGLKNL